MKSSTMKSSMKKSSIERVVARVRRRAPLSALRRGRSVGRVGTTASPSTLPFAVRVFDGLFALKFESVSRSSDSKIRSSDSKIRSTRVWRDGTSIAIDVLCRRGARRRSQRRVVIVWRGGTGEGHLARAGRTRVDRDGGARIARLVVSARLAPRARRLDPSGRFPFLLVLARRRSSRGGVRQVKSSRRRAPCVRLGSDGGAPRRGGSHELPPERTPEKRTHAIASAIKPASPLVKPAPRDERRRGPHRAVRAVGSGAKAGALAPRRRSLLPRPRGPVGRRPRRPRLRQRQRLPRALRPEPRVQRRSRQARDASLPVEARRQTRARVRRPGIHHSRRRRGSRASRRHRHPRRR